LERGQPVRAYAPRSRASGVFNTSSAGPAQRAANVRPSLAMPAGYKPNGSRSQTGPQTPYKPITSPYKPITNRFSFGARDSLSAATFPLWKRPTTPS